MQTARLIPLIGMCGVARSGKNTAADYLFGRHGYRQVAFALPIKVALTQLCGWSLPLLQGDIGDREAVDPAWGFSPRQAMQHLGAGMRALDPAIWCKIGMRTAGKLRGMGCAVVFTDVRHHNEVASIREAGGQVWRCNRAGAGLEGEKAQHESERHVSELSVDLELDNNGTLEQLYAQIDLAVRENRGYHGLRRWASR